MRTATIYNFLVEATLIGSVLILLMLLLRKLCRRAVGSRIIWMAWLLIALRLLVPLALPNPAMNALKPTLSQDAGIRPMADQVRTRVEDTAHSIYWKTFGTDTQRTPLHALTWRLVRATGNGKIAWVVMGVYAIGVVLAAGWIAMQNLRFHHVLKRRRAGSLSPQEQAAYETQCKLRGYRPLPVWKIVDLSGSSLMGWVRPVILLPADAPCDLIPAMLLRETCHHRGHDNWWSLLRSLCCILHWFNPLVWAAMHVSRIDNELACDERALAPMNEEGRKVYARLLLSAREVHHTTPTPVVAASCLTMREKPQRMRIHQALHFAPRRPWATGVFCLMCAAVCVGMFATAEQSSTKNVPTLYTARIRTAATAITTQEAAEGYARAFLSLEGIDVNAQEQPVFLVQTAQGWQAEVYPADTTAPCYLCFTEKGEILSFENTALKTDRLHPLAEPIVNQSAEGQQWCDFLSEFLQRHMPECWEAFEVMSIVNSGRLDGERFITIHLLDIGYQPLWEAVIQVAPQGRILSLTRWEAAEQESGSALLLP